MLTFRALATCGYMSAKIPEGGEGFTFWPMDYSGSFSHRYICNCNEVQNIDLKRVQKAIIRASENRT